MPVFAILRLSSNDATIAQEKFALDRFSIFTRPAIRSFIRALARSLAEKATATRDLVEVHEHLNDAEEVKIFTLLRPPSRIIVITDSEYSSEIARRVVLEAFRTSDFDRLIREYRAWEDKDLLSQVERELKDCHVVVLEGLSQLMQRGETLSELVDKSESLNAQTKLLFKTAKKKNRCC